MTGTLICMEIYPLMFLPTDSSTCAIIIPWYFKLSFFFIKHLNSFQRRYACIVIFPINKYLIYCMKFYHRKHQYLYAIRTHLKIKLFLHEYIIYSTRHVNTANNQSTQPLPAIELQIFQLQTQAPEIIEIYTLINFLI